MRAGWMASGACISGSTALPGDATRRDPGGCATTSTARAESSHGYDADGRRRDDDDGLDAYVRPELDRRRGVVPCHVDAHDGSDDAAVTGPDVVALPAFGGQGRGVAAGVADRARRGGLPAGLGAARRGNLSARCRGHGAHDAL